MRTFLDSDVLIAAFQGRAEISDTAFAIIRDTTRQFVASDFLALELLPKPTFFRNDDEVAFYREYLSRVVTTVPTTPQRIAEAANLGERFGLAGPDAIHASAAIKESVQEFVTAERATSPLCQIPPTELRVTSIRPRRPPRNVWAKLRLKICTAVCGSSGGR